MSEAFAPGDLVWARGREWVAMPAPDADSLLLRPLSGTEADSQILHPALERELVRHARFAMQAPAPTANQDAAPLLAQAPRLRSDERPGGQEGVRTCRTLWSPVYSKITLTHVNT